MAFVRKLGRKRNRPTRRTAPAAATIIHTQLVQRVASWMTKRSWSFGQVRATCLAIAAHDDGTRLLLGCCLERLSSEFAQMHRREADEQEIPMKALMATAAAVALLAGIATANAQNAPAKIDKSEKSMQSTGGS